MGMNFTPEQQKVIELHNSNILVSAAAGSGKTAVLVERIIRMICEGEHPADIDRLLIVTFTNTTSKPPVIFLTKSKKIICNGCFRKRSQAIRKILYRFW